MCKLQKMDTIITRITLKSKTSDEPKSKRYSEISLSRLGETFTSATDWLANTKLLLSRGRRFVRQLGNDEVRARHDNICSYVVAQV